jgi:predicted nucleic acid-binding Zn ribbon protein
MFECLVCSKPTTTGTFCGERCANADHLSAETLEQLRLHALLEARMWDAVREAAASGVWN